MNANEKADGLEINGYQKIVRMLKSKKLIVGDTHIGVICTD